MMWKPPTHEAQQQQQSNTTAVTQQQQQIKKFRYAFKYGIALSEEFVMTKVPADIDLTGTFIVKIRKPSANLFFSFGFSGFVTMADDPVQIKGNCSVNAKEKDRAGSFLHRLNPENSGGMLHCSWYFIDGEKSDSFFLRCPRLSEFKLANAKAKKEINEEMRKRFDQARLFEKLEKAEALSEKRKIRKEINDGSTFAATPITTRPFTSSSSSSSSLTSPSPCPTKTFRSPVTVTARLDKTAGGGSSDLVEPTTTAKQYTRKRRKLFYIKKALERENRAATREMLGSDTEYNVESVGSVKHPHNQKRRKHNPENNNNDDYEDEDEEDNNNNNENAKTKERRSIAPGIVSQKTNGVSTTKKSEGEVETFRDDVIEEESEEEEEEGVDEDSDGEEYDSFAEEDEAPEWDGKRGTYENDEDECDAYKGEDVIFENDCGVFVLGEQQGADNTSTEESTSPSSSSSPGSVPRTQENRRTAR